MYTVKITRVAEEDLSEAVEYISEKLKAPIAANNLLDLIEQKIKLLADSPFSCRLLNNEYFQQKGIRFLQVKSYIIFFRIQEDKNEISIIRILYARRDWVTLLSDKKFEE